MRQAAEEEEEEEADDPNMVYVYGKQGDKNTDAMYKALQQAGIGFTKRDLASEGHKAKEALAASGCSGKPAGPVVVRGKKAWWDDGKSGGGKGDDMFAIPFPQAVAMELRHEMSMHGGGMDEPVPVRSDANLDEEIEERFSSMQKAFLKCDENKDGRITKKELMMKCKEWNIPTSEAERILAEADVNHDSTLDFNEFAKRFSMSYNRGTPKGNTLRTTGKIGR